MNSIDVLNYSISGGFLVLVAVLSWLVWHAVLTLKVVRSIAIRIEDATRDISLVKDGIKTGFFSIIGKLLGNK